VQCGWLEANLHEFFIGRQLNPSIGSFDIKTFNELRPGLILWVVLLISMVCEQAVRRGGFSKVTDSMWLVVAFEGWYVADGLYNEVRLFSISNFRLIITTLVAGALHNHGRHN
jgi:hypothetical protein